MVLKPVVYSTDRSKAMVPVLVLLFVALWFILQGDLLYVLPCVILFLCFSVLLVLRLPCLGKRELILVHFVRLFDLCLFGFVGFLFLLVSGKGAVCDCGTPWTFLMPFFECSSLNSHLYRKNIIESPSCSSGGFGSNYHYVLTCPKYANYRNRYLVHNLQKLN